MKMSTAASSLTEIPIIDLAPLIAPDARPEDIQKTAEAIGWACRNVGFFYIRNHGLPADHREKALAEVKRFFDLPREEKMKLHMRGSSQFRGYVPLCGEITEGKKDWHECIDLQPLEDEDGTARVGRHALDDPGQWPETLPSFRQVMMQSWDQLYGLSGKVAEGIARSLGLEARYFEAFAGPDLCALRLTHYPAFRETARTDDIDSGMGAHCDLGFLAILQQDDVGGLEVLRADGQWIEASHIPGTCLVNIGEMMQRWTNDVYRATLHRVRLPGDRSRYATPFFFEPRYDTVVVPLPVCCSEDDPPRYEPFLFGEYLTGRFSKAYKAKAPAPEDAQHSTV
jgi:isopenicillin N synthase-like dioxygenase